MNSRIVGRHAQARLRPNPDPVVASGIRGVDKVRLDVPPGRKRVTIWSEDPGEWETLQQALNRTITVNGKIALNQRQSPAQWIAGTYLGARWREHDASMDAWTAYGRFRGNVASIIVDAPAGITIDFAGPTLDDRYVSAVLVEPAESSAGLTQVTADRTEWYRTNWRKAPAVAQAYGPETARAGRVHTYRLTTARENAAPSASTDPKPPTGDMEPVRLQPATAVLAPGAGARLTLALHVPEDLSGPPAVTVTAPRNAQNSEDKLRIQAWAGQWRLDRSEPQDTQLHLRDDRLVSDLQRLDLTPKHPRRYEIWVSADDDTRPDRYVGAFNVIAAGRRFTIPLHLTVANVKLPAVRKPAGLYLTYAPHLLWFEATPSAAIKQAACDIRFLNRFALHGSAPPVSVPASLDTAAFLTEMHAAAEGGVAPGWLLYNPLHQMRLVSGPEKAARFAAAATRAMQDQGLPPPLWSAADEPSNPDQDSTELRDWIARLRRTAGPGIKLAGHLNAPGDEKFTSLFDTLIVNAAFGMDRNQIGRLSSASRHVWFYNTFRPRLTAGIWLHFTHATRYVQWHARMPTANPLDPIDGREGDVQFFYPDTRKCPATPDIHRDLLRMAEGVLDQRWLQWLDGQQSSQARQVQKAIRALVPQRWVKATELSDRDLGEIRRRIEELAVTNG